MGKDILHRIGNGGHCGCETVSREVLPQVEFPEKWTQEPPCFAITIWCAIKIAHQWVPWWCLLSSEMEYIAWYPCPELLDWYCMILVYPANIVQNKYVIIMSKRFDIMITYLLRSLFAGKSLLLHSTPSANTFCLKEPKVFFLWFGIGNILPISFRFTPQALGQS